MLQCNQVLWLLQLLHAVIPKKGDVMNKKWSEKTTLEKAVSFISGIALCIWLLFEVLERKVSLPYANTVNCIAILVVCVCEAISFWKVKRALSYVAIGGAICIIAVMVLGLMLKV